MVDEKSQAHKGMILVIDDEAPVREAVEDVMAMIGVGVWLAENGLEGIRLFQERMPEIDLVLLDLSMPGLSGQETLQQLRLLNPNVKVILSSGYSAEDVKSQFDNVTGFLQKPYNLAELIKQISQHLLTE